MSFYKYNKFKFKKYDHLFHVVKYIKQSLTICEKKTGTLLINKMNKSCSYLSCENNSKN